MNIMKLSLQDYFFVFNMNYATIDKELLCVVATRREFHSMLFGADLHIHTDHRNILNVGDSSERRLRWILYVRPTSNTKMRTRTHLSYK